MKEEKSLGERLKKFRGKQTQEEVSKVLGLSRARYSHYENNRVEPDMEILNKMADYFDTTIDYLLGRTDDPNPSNQSKVDFDIFNIVIAPKSEVEEQLLWMKYKEKDTYELSFEEFKQLHTLNNSSNQSNINVVDKKIVLTQEELRIFKEQKKHPILFHDLASNPEKKVKELIKLYRMKKIFLEDEDEEYGEGFGGIED